MSWSDRSTWQRIRLVLGWTFAGLFVLAVTFPFWVKSIGLQTSLAMDRKLEELRTLYSVAERYRSEHDGRNPPTVDALKPYLPVRVDTKHREASLTLADVRADYRYNHQAKDEQALFISYIDRYAAVWITASGRLHMGRRRVFGIIWPRWEYRGGSWPIRWKPLSDPAG